MNVSDCELAGVYEARAMLKRERRLGCAEQHVIGFTKRMHADASDAFVTYWPAVSMRRQVAGQQFGGKQSRPFDIAKSGRRDGL